jgi:exosome complex RNA-binding protein Rrp4
MSNAALSDSKAYQRAMERLAQKQQETAQKAGDNLIASIQQLGSAMERHIEAMNATLTKASEGVIDRAASVAAKDRTDELLNALGTVGAEVKLLKEAMLLDVHLVTDDKGNPIKAIKRQK